MSDELQAAVEFMVYMFLRMGIDPLKDPEFVKIMRRHGLNPYKVVKRVRERMAEFRRMEVSYDGIFTALEETYGTPRAWRMFYELQKIIGTPSPYFSDPIIIPLDEKEATLAVADARKGVVFRCLNMGDILVPESIIAAMVPLKVVELEAGRFEVTFRLKNRRSPLTVVGTIDEIAEEGAAAGYVFNPELYRTALAKIVEVLKNLPDPPL
ncbi:MAG: hypothetical protein QW794_09340 [Thermosphaera sp.]